MTHLRITYSDGPDVTKEVRLENVPVSGRPPMKASTLTLSGPARSSSGSLVAGKGVEEFSLAGATSIEFVADEVAA